MKAHWLASLRSRPPPLHQLVYGEGERVGMPTCGVRRARSRTCDRTRQSLAKSQVTHSTAAWRAPCEAFAGDGFDRRGPDPRLLGQLCCVFPDTRADFQTVGV